MLQIHTHTTLSKELEKQWQGLWERSTYAHPFNAPAWYLACVKTYHYKQMRIVTAYDDDKLVGLVPLVRSKRLGLESWMFPGGKHIDMSCLLLAQNDLELLSEILVFLKSNLTCYLQEISSEDIVRVKDQISNKNNNESSQSPYLLFGEDPFAQVPQSQMYKIKRKASQHQNHLYLKQYRADEQSLTIVYDIEKRSHKMSACTTMFTNEQDRLFYTNLAKEFGDMLRVDVLFYDKSPMVYSIGFLHRGVYYGINTAYDQSYKAMIPGKLLVYKLICTLHKSGGRAFYFSRGINAIKLQFTNTITTQHDLYFARSEITLWWWKQTNKFVQAVVQNARAYHTYKQTRITLGLG